MVSAQQGPTRSTVGPTSPGPPLSVVLVNAAALDVRRRSGLSGPMFGRALPFRELAGVGETPFGARAQLRLEPDLGIWAAFSPKPSWQGALEGDDVMLLRPTGGRLVVSRAGQEVEIGPREAVLLCGVEGARFRFEGVDRVDVMPVARSRLTVAGDMAPDLMRLVRRDHAGLRMLSTYSAGLLRGLIPVASAELRDLVLDHLHRLLAFIASHQGHEAAAAPLRRQDARLQAIKAEVELRLGRRDLTADHVARLQRVSSRHVQQLFKAEGQTFSEFVLGRRLDRAMQILSSAEDRRPVSQIAFEVGFGDVSYFNRTFRTRFGHTPTQARRTLRSLES